MNRNVLQYIAASVLMVCFVLWSSHRLSLAPISHLLWTRPAVAPNGSPWPTTSNYVAGYRRLNVFGPATVTADNSRGSRDLFAKLVDLDQTPPKAVRVFRVKPYSKFALQSVKPGHYDLRYMDLDTGVIQKSAPFEVTQRTTSKGEEYMGWTIGLYGVISGSSPEQTITEREF